MTSLCCATSSPSSSFVSLLSTGVKIVERFFDSCTGVMYEDEETMAFGPMAFMEFSPGSSMAMIERLTFGFCFGFSRLNKTFFAPTATFVIVLNGFKKEIDPIALLAPARAPTFSLSSSAFLNFGTTLVGVTKPPTPLPLITCRTGVVIAAASISLAFGPIPRLLFSALTRFALPFANATFSFSNLCLSLSAAFLVPSRTLLKLSSSARNISASLAKIVARSPAANMSIENSESWSNCLRNSSAAERFI
mmetsp:Transcript_7691/g.22972  ORF Transcript_7691/g.22972 Transcript_7691/m.22972 type:complete len:249 (-) Transcript_7691:242-988(-)